MSLFLVVCSINITTQILLTDLPKTTINNETKKKKENRKEMFFSKIVKHVFYAKLLKVIKHMARREVKHRVFFFFFLTIIFVCIISLAHIIILVRKTFHQGKKSASDDFCLL